MIEKNAQDEQGALAKTEGEKQEGNEALVGEMDRMNQAVNFLKAIETPLKNAGLISADTGGIRVSLPGGRSIDYEIYNDDENRINWEILVNRAKDFLASYQPESPEIGEAEKRMAELLIEITNTTNGDKKILTRIMAMLKKTFAMSKLIKRGVDYNEKAIGSYMVTMTEDHFQRIFQEDPAEVPVQETKAA